MKARHAKAKTKRKPSRRLPQRLVDRMLRDLVGRIDEQLNFVEAMETANKPNGQHILVEHQLRTVFGALIERQLRGLRDIATFARLILRDG